MTIADKRPPDVVFIGYMRAGSTFLRSYFSSHPDIEWTRHAGSLLLAGSDHDIEEYRSVSARSTSCGCLVDMYEGLCLGVSVADADEWNRLRLMPIRDKVTCPVQVDQEAIAGRIHHALPNAGVLIIIRNQVDWLRSMYFHHLKGLPAGKTGFKHFLRTPIGRSARAAGIYDQTIKTYQDVFGGERVCVILMEQLEREREESLSRICDFLRVANAPFSEEAEDRNRGKTEAEVFAARGSAWLPRRMRRLLSPLRVLLRGPAERFLSGRTLPKRDRGSIDEFYRVSNQETCRLLGLDLADYGYPT